MAKGDTLVAATDERIIGVVTLSTVSATDGSPFYERADVARVGQFAVEPEHQKVGIGSALLTFVEALARERGVQELALDTSEHAVDLIQFYTLKGYRFIEFIRWPNVNYRSVVLAKKLGSPAA
jgi:GNAT superfamily N-acetyltransferase